MKRKQHIYNSEVQLYQDCDGRKRLKEFSKRVLVVYAMVQRYNKDKVPNTKTVSCCFCGPVRYKHGRTHNSFPGIRC